LKRHPSLAWLSRDHHHALALARDLRRLCSEETRDAQAFIAGLRRRFDEELAPHFAIEERELVRRCVEKGEPLATPAARVLADHDALRAMITDLEPTLLGSQREAFGARLEDHVRFEERVWFPAIEEHLGSETLARLADELRPLRRMPRLPADVAPYKQTAVFDAQSVPSALRRSHALKAETWGEIIVEQGCVLYVLEDEGDWGVMLRPGVVGVIAPERPHHVEPDDDARFFVRFSKRT
jgi:tellurite resistance-related uncharacterized protein